MPEPARRAVRVVGLLGDAGGLVLADQGINPLPLVGSRGPVRGKPVDG
jgi:hypothetical protein